MKILLVYPRTKYPSGDIPIGLSILSAIAKREGHEVSLFDASFKKDPFGDFQKLLSSRRYDCVGFSIMTSTAATAKKMAAMARTAQPDAQILIGGPHPTVLPERTLADTGADLCVVGEGEEAFRSFLRGVPAEQIAGAATVRDGCYKANPRVSFATNLDEMPYPDFSAFDVKKYIANWFSLDGVSVASRGVNIMATRGCPFRCAFCQPTLKTMFGEKVRKHSAQYITGLLGELKSKYVINSFMFEDDTFTADRKWCLETCDALSRAGLGLYWGCNTHVNSIDEVLLLAMKRAGMKKIYFGIESANQRTLDEIYHKGFKLTDANEKIRMAARNGIKTHAYFIIGAPTETEREIKNTIRFAAASPLDEASFSICAPLPGAELFEKYRGHISADIEDIDYYSSASFDEKTSLPAARLVALRKEALVRFYGRGSRAAAILAGLAVPGGFRKLLLKLMRA